MNYISNVAFFSNDFNSFLTSIRVGCLAVAERHVLINENGIDALHISLADKFVDGSIVAAARGEEEHGSTH